MMKALTSRDQKQAMNGFRREERGIDIKQKKTIEIYVKGEQGPPLILLHELPGLSNLTFELADYFVSQKFRVLMPLLFGKAGERNMLRNSVEICLRRELRKLCLGKDGEIVRMIRELARQELNKFQETDPSAPGVAVVGMCFTGSMVLALLLKEGEASSPVAAPVMAQPTSGYSAKALQSVEDGSIQGPVLALRFEKDWICSRKKLSRLEDAFSACPLQKPSLIVHELEGRGHSTLVYHYNNKKRRDLRTPSAEPIDAREAVTAFIKAQLNQAHIASGS